MGRFLFTLAGVAVCCCCCTGCMNVEHTTRGCLVVDADDGQPIGGVEVWMQPIAPIHPFWPAGDKGVTNANGETTLSLPSGFWFYMMSAKAGGYRQVPGPTVDSQGGWDGRVRFYMKRDAARTGTDHIPTGRDYIERECGEMPAAGGRVCRRSRISG